MAVEGIHDSNLYIKERVNSFQLLSPNYPTFNSFVFTFTEVLVVTFLNDDGSNTIDTSLTEVISNTWVRHITFPTETIYYFGINSDGHWAIFTLSKNADGTLASTSENTLTQHGGDDPSQIDFSKAYVQTNNTFQGSSINVLSNTIRKLNSIQNISFDQNVQENVSLVVGSDLSPTDITGPTQTTVSIDKILNNKDFIHPLAGRTDISGQFEYGDNTLSFNKACINNFSVNATVRELPQASFDFTIYGSLSGSATSVASTASSDDTIEEVTAEGLIATFDKQSTNAVQSFNFSEIFNKQAIYGLGSDEPGDIKTVGPIQQEAVISIEVENYEPEETFSFLRPTPGFSRGSIKLEISGDSQIINTFELNNPHLVSESLSAGVGGTIVANLTYRGYKKV